MLVAPVVPTLAPDNRRARVRPAQDALAPRERERLTASAGYPCAVLEVRPMLRAVLCIRYTVDHGHDYCPLFYRHNARPIAAVAAAISSALGYRKMARHGAVHDNGRRCLAWPVRAIAGLAIDALFLVAGLRRCRAREFVRL